MNDDVIITRDDRAAILAALRGIEQTMKQIAPKAKLDDGAHYTIWKQPGAFGDLFVVHLTLN